ncbi:DUF2059 domain-containing protein [bacterium]|nr:DUF2059 domain-containing protein [bacterium]
MERLITTKIVALGIVVSLALAGCAAKQCTTPILDTPENRAVEAHRYLETTSTDAMFRDMAQGMASTLPEGQVDAFMELITELIDMEALEAFMHSSLVKHFTAEELGALADFYGSDVGKSAMSKMGAYMADAMPYIQQQVIGASLKAKQKDQ